MRLTDAVFAFPALLLIVLLQSVVLGGLLTLTLAMGLITWPLYARLVRGQLLTTLDAEYVIAARALGAHPARILWTHLLPNARPALLVAWVFAIPQAVFLEASWVFWGSASARPPPAGAGSSTTATPSSSSTPAPCSCPSSPSPCSHSAPH